ncbi:hypothetical protein [Flavobacterium sp. LAR06]|uniref:hypothetical protein n=1 Tax=Flavobacterium sp. LAR06 TaxID=3064897 RepID=UPI0035C107FB
MKNFIIIFCSLFILSCSNDNSSSEENSNGNILKSYKEGGANGNVHYFENAGSRYEKIVLSTGETLLKFEYDSNNKMTKITLSPEWVPVTTSFTYNSSGQIIKMEKDNRATGVTGKLTVWLFSYTKNVITGEVVSDEDPNFNHRKVKYTFNDDGLLISRHNYIDFPAKDNRPIITNSYLTLKYDQNRNVILLKKTNNGTHDLPDSQPNIGTYSITYEYDDKINPMHEVYMNHYINYILSNDYPFNLEIGTYQDRVTGTGTNNLIKTIFPIAEGGGIPVDNVYKNTFTYQLNNLPSKMSRISTADNKEYGSLIYTYSSK